MNRRYRLSNNASFLYIYRKGKAVSSHLLTIVFVPATSVKVGFSVSKKVGKSVVRSRVTRRLRECFRPLIQKLKGTFNYVVVAKPPIADASFEEIGNELLRALKRANHIANG